MSTEQARPAIFVASSSERLDIAEYVQAILQPHFDITLWTQGTFRLSRTNLDSLVRATKRSGYAILVCDPDDVTLKRDARNAVVRDNVIFELGLFIGSLGVERTFMIHERTRPPDLPSDMSGISAAVYRLRPDGNLRSALAPACLEIREAINEIEEAASVAARQSEGHKAVASEGDVSVHFIKPLTYLEDLTSSLALGRVGVDVVARNAQMVARWRGNVLGMIRDAYLPRASDVYSAWLKPTELDGERRLIIADSRGLPDGELHYQYAYDEGMAGKAWAHNVSAAYSRNKPHPWWVFREGCENATYVCAPIGPDSMAAGLLAVGSNQGFDLQPFDEPIVSNFAALFAVTLSAEAASTAKDHRS